MSDLKIEFNLGDHGWLDICILEQDKRLTIPASYLSDSIKEMIDSLCIFIEGSSEVIFRFQTEPGEYRFRLKDNGEVCLFEIYEFNTTFSRDELQDGKCIVSTRIEADKLINKFYREIFKLKEIEENEFKSRWGYDFPKEAFERFIKDRKNRLKEKTKIK